MRLPRKDLNALADRAAGSSSTREIRELLFKAFSLGATTVGTQACNMLYSSKEKETKAEIAKELDAKVQTLGHDAHAEARR